MPLEIIRNDITKMRVDAIVNAANTRLQMGGGVCGAIFDAAGAKELQEACDEVGGCATGCAVATDAFRLDADYIIHAVGPVWHGGGQDEEALLRSAYRRSLQIATERNCKSIAFPLISSGIYGYPKEQALQVAISEIHNFLLENEMQVYLVVFDKKSFGISNKLLRSIEAFIDEHYVEKNERLYSRNRHFEFREEFVQQELQDSVSSSLEEMLNRLDEPFSASLLRFIDEKGMTDVETYKKANIDRKLFSKIRNSPNYTPMKKTVLAFAVALELTLEETEDLLARAGYAFSRSNKFDVIIEYFILNRKYNIHEINEALFMFDQTLLGA